MADSFPRDEIARATRAAFGPAARIAAVQPLAGDASSRRYLRLALADAAAPTAVVMLLAEGRFGGGDELGGAGAGELPFVAMARYLARHGLPVPVVHYDASRDAGFLLLEDVGDTTLWAAVCADPASARTRFGEAVDLLARLQDVGDRAPDADCPAFSRRFDAALARAEIEHFVDHGIETRYGTRLAGAERRAILDAFEPAVAPFAAGPTALSHRDYMAWNIHVRGSGLVLIDFQDALIAPDAFDLAQLLTDRTTATTLSADDERALMGRFVAARTASGAPPPPGFEDRYRRCALQHALKVIGRFHLLEMVQGKPGYLAYLPAVYGVARRALAALPDCRRGVALVARWVPELAGDAP